MSTKPLGALPEPAATIYRLTEKLQEDLAFAAPELWALHIERRLADAYGAGERGLDVAALSDAITEWWFDPNDPIGATAPIDAERAAAFIADAYRDYFEEGRATPLTAQETEEEA